MHWWRVSSIDVRMGSPSEEGRDGGLPARPAPRLPRATPLRLMLTIQTRPILPAGGARQRGELISPVALAGLNGHVWFVARKKSKRGWLLLAMVSVAAFVVLQVILKT